MSQLRKIIIIIGLLVLSLLVLAFFSHKGTGDMDVWLEWTSYTDRWGPLNAYSIVNTIITDTIDPNNINTNHTFWTTDYPPLTFINLWLAKKTAEVFGLSWMIGIKIMLLVYYLATWVSLIYLSTLFRRKSTWKNITVVSGLYLGTMYFVVISQAFTTLDITFAPYVVFSLALFARRKYVLSGMCFALAVLVKWIAIMMLPVFVFYFIVKKGRRYKLPKTESPRYYSSSLHERASIHSSPRKYVFSRIHLWINMLGYSASEYKIDPQIFKFLGALMLVFGLLIIGFWLNDLSLFSLAESLRKAFSHGLWFLVAGSLNFWFLIQHAVIKPIYPETYPMVIKNNMYIFSAISGVIFLIVNIAILRSFLNRKKEIGNLLQASLMISWSYFIWRTGVHGNHLFITVLIALSLAIINTNKSNIRLYLWLSLFGLASPILTHGFPIGGSFVSFLEYYWLLSLLAAFHVLIYLVYLRRYLQFQLINTKN